MLMNRIVEYTFFFGLMGATGYLVWKMLAPFVSALAVAAIIVTISYPLYERVKRVMPKQNEMLAAFSSTLLVFVIVFTPLFFIASALVNEAVAVYKILSADQVGLEASLNNIEQAIQVYLPGFQLNIAEYLTHSAQFLASNLGAIFTGTASTIFLFFISVIGTYYLFKDGKAFTKRLVVISPLPDDRDDIILRRMAQSLRSVLTGRILVAVIQGVLTALGLWIFGFERAILWGTIATFGALIPSVGTAIVLIPALLYLIFIGSYLDAAGLAVWGILIVGLIDNLLGPYLMSRGNSMHPFIVLLSVLGGIVFFGPIGFIAGPVVVTLFLVLLELYSQHIALPPNSTHDD